MDATAGWLSNLPTIPSLDYNYCVHILFLQHPPIYLYFSRWPCSDAILYLIYIFVQIAFATDNFKAKALK